MTWATLPGSPGRAIVDRASADADALVVMSTHGRVGLACWALGSVTDRVLHSVPNPVLIIRATPAEPPPVYFFVAAAFWNLVGAGLFGFLINPPIALYYMQGLNTTSVHAYARCSVCTETWDWD